MKGLLDTEDGRFGMDRAVELAHCHLGLDAVFLAELTDGGQVYRAIAGDLASFQIAVDATGDAGYSRGLIAGSIPGVVPNTAEEERLAALAMTCEAGVGAFIGVPLTLSDGSPYGALCGLGHEPDHTLDERDLRFLSMLGDLIVQDLDEQRSRERLHADLTQLVATENVDMAYQPILDVHRGGCIGIEALARFPRPFGPPDVTLAAAATVGLGLELERLAIQQAWRIIPALGAGQFLAVNVSPHALIELARRANLRDDLPLSQLVVEITEHAAVQSYAPLHDQLEPLRLQGLRIAVDDAGAGYASLRHVLELRPDFIKVDRSLIHGIADDHARRVAVSAFLSLALDLGSTVVAEGVERPVDLDVVRELGLHAAQGFLLGKPTTNTKAVARALSQTEGEARDALGPDPRAGARRKAARSRHAKHDVRA
jgi:EAL domain-containing protein (putative c-di-GMP-specific phosphodiesterase class I)